MILPKKRSTAHGSVKKIDLKLLLPAPSMITFFPPTRAALDAAR